MASVSHAQIQSPPHVGNFSHMLVRILVYVVGCFFASFGVTTAIHADLGTSPVGSVPYVLSLMLPLDVGMFSTVIYCIAVALQIILLRQKPNWQHGVQIGLSFMFGAFINLTNWMLGDFYPVSYFGKLALAVIGMVALAVGLVIYLETKLLSLPVEGLTNAISVTMKISFSAARNLLDIAFALMTIALSVIFLGEMKGVGEATVLSAILVGRLLHWVRPFVAPVVSRICFPDEVENVK